MDLIGLKTVQTFFIIRNFVKKTGIIFLLLFSLKSMASRSMIAPPILWHDWYDITSNPAGSILIRALDISIQNQSNLVQTVKITCTPIKSNFWVGGSWGSLPRSQMRISATNIAPQLVDSVSDMSFTIILNPLDSIVPHCTTEYRGPGSNGDYHLRGAFIVKFEITEDRGAISVMIDTRMEASGQIGLQVNNPLIWGALRTVAKTYYINGERPF